MRRIGLALAIAVAAAGCSSFPGSSSSGPEDPVKADVAGTEKGFADAATLYANKRYEQAARLCEKTIQTRPYYAPAHLLLARSCHAAGKDDSAIPRYRALLNLSPNHVEGLTELAAIYRTRGEADQAVPLLQRAFERTEGREDVAVALAECLAEAGETEQAQEFRLAHLQEPPPSEEADAPVPPPSEDDVPTAPPQPPVGEPTPTEGGSEPVPQPVEEPQPTAELPTPPSPKTEASPPVARPEPPKPVTKDAAPVAEKPKKASPPARPMPPEPKVVEQPVRLSPEAQQWIEEGDRSLAEGLAADALEAYKKSREHGGPEAILAARVERATRSREEAQRTVRDLTGAVRSAADQAGHRLKLAAAYLQDGRYLEAQLLLVQVTVIAPDSGEGFYLLGVAYERRSEWGQAAEAFKRAQTLCAGTALEVQAGFHLDDISAHLDH